MIRVSVVAAVLSTVDVPYAVSVSKVSSVPAFVGVPAVAGSLPWFASLLILDFPLVLATILLPSIDVHLSLVLLSALLLLQFFLLSTSPEFLMWLESLLWLGCCCGISAVASLPTVVNITSATGVSISSVASPADPVVMLLDVTVSLLLLPSLLLLLSLCYCCFQLSGPPYFSRRLCCCFTLLLFHPAVVHRWLGVTLLEMKYIKLLSFHISENALNILKLTLSIR